MRAFLIALGSLSLLSFGHAGAQERTQSLKGNELQEQQISLQRQIHRCVRVRPTANARVTLSFVLGKGGTVEGRPTVVEKPVDAHGEKLLAAATRAILECAPYRTKLTGEIVAPFVLSAAESSTSANPAAGLDLGPKSQKPEDPKPTENAGQAEPRQQTLENAPPSEPHSGDAAASLKAQLLNCYVPSPEAKGRIVVAFDADEKGVARNARVIEGGETDGEKLLASAAVRAIFRCSPYKLPAADTVRVTFEGPDMSQLADTAASRNETTYVEDRIRHIALQGATFRYEAPEGFCALDREKSPFDRGVWERMEPRKELGDEMIALEVDCETLELGRERARVLVPRRAFRVSGAARATDLPSKLSDNLAVLHERSVKREPLTERFWQDPPVEGNPVTGIDEFGIYFGARSLNDDGSIAIAGMMSITLAKDKQLSFTLMDLTGANLADDMPARVMRTTKSLHDLSK